MSGVDVGASFNVERQVVEELFRGPKDKQEGGDVAGVLGAEN